MKQLIFISILILTCCLAIFAQQSSPCPQLKLEAPKKVQEGDLVTFNVRLEANQDIQNVSLKWQAFKNEAITDVKDNYDSEKKIKTITIDTTALKLLKVSVEIPENALIECNTKLFATVKILPPPPIIRDPFFSYSCVKCNFEKEKPHLDSFVVDLANNFDSSGFITFYVTKDEKLPIVKSHILKVMNYVRNHKYNKKNILFAVYKAKLSSTVLSIIPPAATLPICKNCEQVNIGKLKL